MDHVIVCTCKLASEGTGRAHYLPTAGQAWAFDPESARIFFNEAEALEALAALSPAERSPEARVEAAPRCEPETGSWRCAAHGGLICPDEYPGGRCYEVAPPQPEAQSCAACGDPLSERRTYDGATRKLTRVELYCYGCENAELWRLARTVGK
jgi:hypothetical protein